MGREPTDRRRKVQRFQMNLPVEVHLPGDDGPQTSEGQTRDVSFRGLYLTMANAPKLGSPLDFVLTLPGEITRSADVRIRCVGRVVRVETEVEGEASANGSKPVGVAAIIEQYAFLPSTSDDPTV